MSSDKRVVIIGAGPCGIGAAVRLHQQNHKNWVVLEAGPKAGGLATTVHTPEGFMFDMGAHVNFSHYSYYDDVLNAAVADWKWHERRCWVLKSNTWVPYPYQNNIHRLPEKEKFECLNGLVSAKQKVWTDKPKTFQDWIDRNFGDGIANTFLNPYNYKVWAYRPVKMAAHWMGERVPTVDLSRIVNNIIHNTDDVGWGPNATFRFPIRGGTGGVWESIAAMVHGDEHFRYNTKVDAIDVDRKVVIVNGGEEIPYDYLMSTMPLDLLLGALKTSDAKLADVASRRAHLTYSSTNVIGLGLRGATPPLLAEKWGWMYFPDSNCPFYRATVFSNFSEHHCPSADTHSIMFEVSESPDKAVPADVVTETIQGAINCGMVESFDQVICKYHTRLDHGYPTPYVERDTFLNEAQPLLMEHAILSRGRFGGWKYEVANQDHSFMQGVEAMDLALFGIEETTYWYPDLVNGRVRTDRRYTPGSVSWAPELAKTRR